MGAEEVRRDEVRQIKEADLPAWLAGEVDDLELATKKDLRAMKEEIFTRLDKVDQSAKTLSRLLTGLLVSIILTLLGGLIAFVSKSK